MGCKKNTVIVTPLSISNVFGEQSWGCWEKKNDFFFFIKIWYSIMAIICGIVQLFDHIFFSGGCDNLIPNFPPNCCFSFFFISQSNFWGFFSVILSFCLMRYVKLVENSNWFLYVPQKTHTDFCHTLGFFLVVSPILMYIDGASES